MNSTLLGRNRTTLKLNNCQKMEKFSEENHSDSTVFEQKSPINLNSSMEETPKNVYCQKMEIISEYLNRSPKIGRNH